MPSLKKLFNGNQSFISQAMMIGAENNKVIEFIRSACIRLNYVMDIATRFCPAAYSTTIYKATFHGLTGRRGRPLASFFPACPGRSSLECALTATKRLIMLRPFGHTLKFRSALGTDICLGFSFGLCRHLTSRFEKLGGRLDRILPSVFAPTFTVAENEVLIRIKFSRFSVNLFSAIGTSEINRMAWHLFFSYRSYLRGCGQAVGHAVHAVHEAALAHTLIIPQRYAEA